MERINPYYDKDTWDLCEHPMPYVRNFFMGGWKTRILDFNGFKNEYLKRKSKEYLCYALEEKLTTYKYSKVHARDLYLRWRFGLEFLRVIEPDVTDYLAEYDRLNKAFIEFARSCPGLSIGHHRSGREYIPNNMLSNMRTYILRRTRLGPEPWQKLIWDITDLPLAEERVNPASAFRTLDFSYIRNLEDAECIQRFLYHLVLDTNISFSTIYQYYQSLKIFVLFQQTRQRTFKYANRDDAIAFYKYYGPQVSNSTFDARVSVYHFTYDYLCVYGLTKANPFQMEDKHNDPYHYQLKTVDDETIMKVFSVLHEIPERLACMFLILYATGMRVSEVCQIKNSCLFTNEKGCFLQFYCQKLKKEVMNPIPPALYDRIESIVIENSALPYAEKYLFHSAPNQAYHSTTFQAQLNEALAPYHIMKPDGTPFIFRPHDFRHTLATKMYRSNIDIPIIQGILHHASIEMTMAYVERDEAYMKNKSAQFLDYRGEVLDDESEAARITWMRDNLKAQALPNGLCALPVNLGKCPHANACLDGCEFFRTNRDYLPQHKEFAARLDAYIELCAENHWTTQRESAERVRKNVLDIINHLEQGGY